MDLEKAFDRVPYHVVVEAAKRWGYPLKILRLSLASYQLRRVVGVGGIFSDYIMPIRELAAGSVHATRELRALMIGVFDQVRHLRPSAMLTVYVDDGTIECAGTEKTMLETATLATEMACEGLVQGGMRLSRTKNILLSSCKRLGEATQEKLKQWHVKRSKYGKMLGVGTAAGVKRTTEGMAERVAAFARRRGLFHGLRRMGVDIAKVLRTGGLTAAQFGQAVHGVADYPLMQLRRKAAGLVGGAAAGKNPNLVLVAADAASGNAMDPAFAAHTDPVVHWASAVWEGWMPVEWLQRTLKNARVELTRAKRQWFVVKGPAAAVCATLARIGWTMVDATTAYTDRDLEVSFLKDSPAMVKRLVRESVRRWRWRAVGMAGGGGHGSTNGGTDLEAGG